MSESNSTAPPSSIDQFGGDIAILKKNEEQGHRAMPLEELDNLCQDMEKRGTPPAIPLKACWGNKPCSPLRQIRIESDHAGQSNLGLRPSQALKEVRPAMSANPEDFDTSDSKLTLAKQLVGLVWGSNSMPATFDVEYEGVKWEVSVRVKGADA